MPQRLGVADLFNVLIRADDIPTEHELYASVWNATANALTAYCADQGLERPSHDTRNRFANGIWRKLYPSSGLGRDDA